MITIKNTHEIEKMRRAGRVTAIARETALAFVQNARPGRFTTADIDRAVEKAILDAGAVPTFLGYGGFPGNACIAVNDEVIHGIPGPRVIHNGDIIKIDVGATLDGFVGDCAMTICVGEPSAAARRLAEVTRESFFKALAVARVGYRISDISNAVQTHVEAAGFTVVKDFIGHGVGKKLHEGPEIPNYGPAGRGPRLLPGMTLAIEPMVNEGADRVRVLEDGWTVVTQDGLLSAHYENTVLITTGEPEILTWDTIEI